MPYHFVTEEGVKKNGGNVIFPILKLVNHRYRLIGTGFSINPSGLFVTAKHVLLDVIDTDGNQTYPIFAMNFYGDNKYMLRPILRCVSSEISDVSVGVLGEMKHNQTGKCFRNKILRLTTEQPKIHSRIVTWAYPKTDNIIEGCLQTLVLKPDFYDGRLEEFLPQGRDRCLIPFPCYRGNIKIYSGASGGPVMDENGRVFGVNCTGFDGEEDISYFARINDILPLAVTDVNIDGVSKDKVTIFDLGKSKQLIFDPQLN